MLYILGDDDKMISEVKSPDDDDDDDNMMSEVKLPPLTRMKVNMMHAHA